MPLQEDANAYYANILDDAVRNPNKYSGSEDSIQHFGNLLEKSYYKPQKILLIMSLRLRRYYLKKFYILRMKKVMGMTLVIF